MGKLVKNSHLLEKVTFWLLFEKEAKGLKVD